MASNLMNVNLYIEIELCIAQLGTQVRRLGTQVRGNILAVSISGAALPYSAVWLHSNTAMTTWSFLQCTTKSPNFYIFLHKVTVIIPY